MPASLKVLKRCRVNDSLYKAITPLVKKVNGEAQHAEAAVCKAQVINGLVIESLLGITDFVTPR